jgi:hypothetical protein
MGKSTRSKRRKNKSTHQTPPPSTHLTIAIGHWETAMPTPEKMNVDIVCQDKSLRKGSVTYQHMPADDIGAFMTSRGLPVPKVKVLVLNTAHPPANMNDAILDNVYAMVNDPSLPKGNFRHHVIEISEIHVFSANLIHQHGKGPLYEQILKYTTRTAMFCLVILYLQAFWHGNLWTDLDWTISNVMVYDYNRHMTHYLLFPCYLIICMTYAMKSTVPTLKYTGRIRMRLGAVVAIGGGIGLIMHPITTHGDAHLLYAGVVFCSSLCWYPETTQDQWYAFCYASLLFIGGFGLGLFGTWLNNMYGVPNAPTSRVPSMCCMLGEFGIFITWGSMVQNDAREQKYIESGFYDVGEQTFSATMEKVASKREQ